jgi:uncharacterized protein involved in type VI secretion and phage assembly
MRPGGPRMPSLDAVQYGVHYAVVCQNQDPDGLARIKVRLPWLDGGDLDQAHWAQLLTPMQGDRFGWYTLPEVDDVVIVMFIAGDVSQPVIIGGVWSSPDFPPEPNADGKNNFRGFRSRAGSRLIFDDTSEVKVVLADKTGRNLVGLGSFASDGAGPNVCAVYKPPMAGAQGVSISSMEGTLELTCQDGKLTVEAGDSIKLSAATAVTVKTGSDLKLEGSAAGKLTSSAPCHHDAPKISIG